MIIRFPYLYTATFQTADPRQGLNQEREVRGDWAELEVRDIDPESAPLFCQVEGFGSGGVPYLIEVRKIGNRYFRPKLVVPDMPYRPLEDGSDRLSAHDLGQLVPLATSHHFRGRIEGVDDNHSADRYREILAVIDNQPIHRLIVHDDRQDVIARHEQATRQLVVIDGMVWEQCLEPRLSIDIGASLPQAVVSVPLPDRPLRPNSQCFPLGMADRIRDMLQEALDDPAFETYPAAQNRRPQWTIDEVQVPQVTYYDASLGKAPWKEVVGVARESFKEFPSGGFEVYSKDYIVAWVDFRDALRRAEADLTKQAVEEVMATWSRAAENAEVEAHLHHRFDSAKTRIIRKHSLEVWQQAINNSGHGRPVAVGIDAPTPYRV
jgi:hypothetical protein|nr:hypothetical protein [Neorhizobium tomejilense]